MSDRNRTAIATYTAKDVMVPDGFAENVDLILQTYAKDLTPQEFSLFAADAHARGLSIVKRQIYATKYGGKMTIIVGIDGYRSQAESHPEYAGQDGPYWCGDDGEWRDVWLGKEPPAAAKVGIYRQGFAAPVVGIALWSEYVNTSNPSWRKFPSTMLAKCAEAQAIRKAFPSKLGGTYVAEEMDQANAIEAPGRVVDRQTGEVHDAPKATVQATVNDPTPEPDGDSAAMRRLHAIGRKHKFDHDELRILADVVSRKYDNVPLASLKEANDKLLSYVANQIESEPQGTRIWLDDYKAKNAPDAPESDADDVQDAEVIETAGSASQAGLTIDISEAEEAEYRRQRTAAQATK